MVPTYGVVAKRDGPREVKAVLVVGRIREPRHGSRLVDEGGFDAHAVGRGRGVASQAFEAARVALEVGLAQGSRKPTHKEGREEGLLTSTGRLGESPPSIAGAAGPAPRLPDGKI